MIEINKNKRVVINEDGKVIISNDNALIEEHGTHSDISGNYAIDEISVLRLMTALNGTHTIKETDLRFRNRLLYIFTTAEDINAKFEELKNIIDGDVKNNETYKNKIAELQRRVSTLEHQIEQFNSTRNWWERKLIIKE
jgi:hypothetical protein